MITIRNLQKRYGAYPVLRGLNMNISRGDVYGFLGRNGCGKSTTMNIIANIIPKDGGEIILGEGQPVKIGYLPESPTIFRYLTAREYLSYIASCCKYQGDIPARVNEVLDIVGLTQAADRRAKGFSRGMTQRLGMGAAIIGDPELLLFDEPTSALDPQGRSEVIAIINRLKSMGATIILSTHILSDVERVANRIGIMNGGQLVEEGGIKELMAKHGADSINLTIRNLTQENKVKLLSVDFARAEFNPETATFRFASDNVNNAAGRLVSVMAENGIIPDTMSSGSLEELFRKVVDGNA
ncbi:MAG: ABC transporter ATP-binding protein [Oscillospiraceae bacterium]|nr:ABC transporter ATP-binding protein [Oscillospiraceae bacterium]